MLKVLKVEDEQGQYIDAEGNRCNLIYGTYAIGPRASEFDEFETIEEALEHYGLTEYIEPKPKPEPPQEIEKEQEEEKEEEPQEIPNEPEEEINLDEGEITAYRKEENPAGIYQDKNGERYNIVSESFEEVPEGWTAFESEAEAAAAWDLTPVTEEE